MAKLSAKDGPPQQACTCRNDSTSLRPRPGVGVRWLVTMHITVANAEIEVLLHLLEFSGGNAAIDSNPFNRKSRTVNRNRRRPVNTF